MVHNILNFYLLKFQAIRASIRSMRTWFLVTILFLVFGQQMMGQKHFQVPSNEVAISHSVNEVGITELALFGEAGEQEVDSELEVDDELQRNQSLLINLNLNKSFDLHIFSNRYIVYLDKELRPPRS